MAEPDDLALMRVRAGTLFICDERGRLVANNDPERQPAPRVFLGYTTDGYDIWFGREIPDEIATRLQEIVEQEPPIDDLHGVPPILDSIAEVLGQEVSEWERGPAYRFPESLPVPGEAIQITEDNVELARDTHSWLLTELADWWPCFAVVVDGAAVSVCFSSRVGDVVCEAGVDTISAYRRRGYASMVTAAWAGAIRGSGRIPLYSTSWDNLASQGVARRLGLIMYGADASWS